MKKILFLFILVIIIFSPIFVFAEEKIFQAKVIEIIQEEENILSDGTKSLQQKIRLEILGGSSKAKKVIFDGIQNYDVLNKSIYKKGDKVLVVESTNDLGMVDYYITDYVRTNSIKWLFVFFALILLLVGRSKGLRSLVSLIFTFGVVIKFIIPQIIAGANPLVITLIGSLLILFSVIYITEGLRKTSHIAVLSIFVSLFISLLLSLCFVEFAKLTGFAGEEMAYLVNMGMGMVNFKGLLLAGIIIGTLGVLDDVVISQVSAVEEIYRADNLQTRKEVFKKANKIGIAHISSMTNTLFLAYAGVSLPLLVLFVSGESAFSSWGQIINNEAIATEIIRTLSGSIGLILAVPISTSFAVFGIIKNN